MPEEKLENIYESLDIADVHDNRLYTVINGNQIAAEDDYNKLKPESDYTYIVTDDAQIADSKKCGTQAQPNDYVPEIWSTPDKEDINHYLELVDGDATKM